MDQLDTEIEEFKLHQYKPISFLLVNKVLNIHLVTKILKMIIY